MLQHDILAGLNVPTNLIVLAKEGGQGTTIVYDLPSSLIAVGGTEEMKKAAQGLDAKLEALVKYVLE